MKFFLLVDSVAVDFKGKWWLSYFLVVSALFLVVESGFVETEEALPIDCTLTIKSILG